MDSKNTRKSMTETTQKTPPGSMVRQSFSDSDNSMPFVEKVKPLSECVDIDELHDILILGNRFLEVSKEFSGIKYYADQPLHEFFCASLGQPTIETFKAEQMETFKNLLLQEDWTRMPLPDDFKIEELENPLHPFQKNIH